MQGLLISSTCHNLGGSGCYYPDSSNIVGHFVTLNTLLQKNMKVFNIIWRAIFQSNHHDHHARDWDKVITVFYILFCILYFTMRTFRWWIFNSGIITWLCTFSVFTNTRRYSLLRKLTYRSFGRSRGFFCPTRKKTAFYAVFAYFRPFLVFSSNLSNF